MRITHDDGVDEVAPDASSMIESMRAYGYSLETAVADLIDNSISAGASAVWIDTHWAGERSWITITDNGLGMTEEELVGAMRLGSRSPLEERTETDLGRFGLGLKTASLSQCRRLTVASRTSSGRVSIRRWDLDHLAHPDVHGWQLLRAAHPESDATLERIHSLDSGTTVVWECLDRIVHDADKDDGQHKGHFLKLVDGLREHLGMVFHRFIASRSQGLTMHLNGSPIEPWDAFAESHPATLSKPKEEIAVPGHRLPIVVKGYVLPHIDMLGEEAHQALSGPKGWNAQQGFYLYRNRRLIVAGSWLGLGGNRPWTQEEHYKLARIRLDVPSSMDHQWHLDVKKSSATPPPIVSGRLKGLAQDVRNSARAVFAHRGKYGRRARKTDYVRPWRTGQRAGRAVYSIDRKHPVVEAVLRELESAQLNSVEVMLRLIEETVPVEQIWLDSADAPDGGRAPFHGVQASSRRRTIENVYKLVRRVRSIGHRETLDLLLIFDGFLDDESQAIIALLRDGASE